jgi:hypothetical protein
MACHGLNCSNTKLIKAHIVPQGFGRAIRTGEGPLLKVEAGGITKAAPQLGEYDSEILCADCDNILGKNDGYAVDVCKTFKADERAALFEDAAVDAERFSLFILSLLWRASISKRGRYSGVVTFGPYGKIAREIIFGERRIAELRAFKLFVSKLRSRDHDVDRIITDPIRSKLERLNGYTFFLNGFRVQAVVDGRELGKELDSLMINRTNVFRGVYLEFETLPEYQRLLELFAENQKPLKGLTREPTASVR